MTSAAGITCVSVSNTLKPFFILCLLCAFQRGSPPAGSAAIIAQNPKRMPLFRGVRQERLTPSVPSRVEDQTRVAGARLIVVTVGRPPVQGHALTQSPPNPFPVKEEGLARISQRGGASGRCI